MRSTPLSAIPSTRTRSSPPAKSSFLQGDEWAYLAGIVAIVVGALVVFFLFPRKQEEAELLERYHQEDEPGRAAAGGAPVTAAGARA